MWAKVTGDESGRPPNFESMKLWIAKCRGLSCESLSEIIQYLQSECPQCIFKKIPSNEIDINVDLIPAKLFNSVLSKASSQLDIQDSKKRKQEDHQLNSTNKKLADGTIRNKS